MGEIEGAQMFNLRQILQSDPLGVILIDVVDDSADPFYRDQVAAFEIDDHIALKGKEIKIFLEEFDYIHHEIGAFTLVIEAFDGVMEQNLQQFFPQAVVLFGSRIIGIGPVARPAQSRKVL